MTEWRGLAMSAVDFRRNSFCPPTVAERDDFLVGEGPPWRLMDPPAELDFRTPVPGTIVTGGTVAASESRAAPADTTWASPLP